MQAQIEQIRARCAQVVQKAKELYGMDLSHVHIRFDLKGRAAGQARRAGSVYSIRFNRDMLTREAFDHVHNNTVPHEYAHIICFMNPGMGRNHDRGWERVCRALGGSGATRHQEEVVYGKGSTYEYITTAGQAVRLSQKRHNYVQQGGALTYRNGMGAVTKLSPFKIVGIGGRSIVNNPAAVREFVEEVRTIAATNVQVAATVQTATQQSQWTGTSKAAVSREIMLFGYRNKWSYEAIIAEMQRVNSYDRQLARGTFKANQKRVNIPDSFAK